MLFIAALGVDLRPANYGNANGSRGGTAVNHEIEHRPEFARERPGSERTSGPRAHDRKIVPNGPS